MKQSTKRLLSAMICLLMIVAMLPVGALAADNTTVYCQTPGNWTICKAYWWNSSGYNPGWPGVEMTQTEDGIWTYDVPSDAKGLIFTNGSGSQSSDLTVPTDDKVMFVYADKYWTTYGKVEVDESAKYYVAGVAGLCGVAWSPDAAENKMADDDKDGIYTITYTDVAAGKYQFKVTDGTWSNCWGGDGPDGNYQIILDAVSDVTIRFNSADNIIAVDVLAKGDPVVTEPVTANYYVAGSFNGWTNPDAAYQMAAQANGTYTLTFALTAGDYEFKVTAGNWEECWGVDGGNYVFAAVVDGELTITFNPADYSIAISGSCLGGDAPTEPTEPTEPSDAVYIVAGSEALCGSGWNPSDLNNKMSDEDGDGIFTITYTDVAAGEYEFKVTNGTWENAWPGENYKLSVPETMDIIVVFNTMDNSVNVVMGGEPIEPSEPVEGLYIVAGSDALCGSGWDPADLNNQMFDEDGDGIYTITYTDVAAGEYEFKITNGSWANAWPGENYKLTVPETTDVTISFNSADQSITVAFGGETAAIYILAGQDTLCGSNWDPTDTNNKLTDADGDGIFTITYTNVIAGDYMFKVTNGTWDQCWGGDGADGNYVFRLWVKSNVTINFNPETGIITLGIEELEAPTVPSEPDVTETFYYVAGDMNGWTNPDAAYIMNDQGDGIYTLTFAVTAGDHQFKVTDGTWTNCWPGDNYNFKAYNDGEVTVTFNTADFSVNITGECLTEPAPEPMTIISMHVAGSEGLCGSHWDPTANQMSSAMGVYSITFTGVAAGTYEFKFVANGSWDLNWASGIEMPSGEVQTAWFNAQGNSSVVVAEDNSTVTLSFNMTTMDICTGAGATCSVLVEAPAAPETPAASFQVGDQIIIYALESDVAMSTEQKSNNRGQAAIMKDNGSITFGADVQVITLVEGVVEGTFGFQVGEGQYLYAASSKSNHLKTTDTLDANGSWSIVIDEATGEATITANGENARNLLRYNKTSSLFSCYASGQQAVAVYKITGSEPEMPEPKDLELGDNVLILDAGDRDGDTWTFTATEDGTLVINPVAMMMDTGMGVLEEVPAEMLGRVLNMQFSLQINEMPVFDYPAELTVVAGDVVSIFFISNMSAPAELTLNLELIPPVVEEPETQTATLVTNLSTLKAGDQIIIVAQDYDMALSATQNSNNRGQAEIVKNGNTVTFTDAVQIITLEGDLETGFYFNVDGQYLYAASSSKNYLRTQNEADDNAKWALSVDENGELSIVACGEFTRNNLRYNSSNGLFSCYGSGQQPVCIYKLGAEDGTDSNELVLGYNDLTLAAGDQDGETRTFTATEDGALYITLAGMIADNMGVMEEVPLDYLSMVFGRKYAVLINGEQFNIFDEYYTVAAGDVITVQFMSYMGTATELSLFLYMGEVPVEEPSEPGSMGNPLVIETLPFELTVDGSHDIYYTYIAEKDGILVITAPETNYVSVMNYEKIGSTYYVTVTAGEEISINPWGEAAGTYTISYGEIPEEETVKMDFGNVTVSFKEEFLVNIYFTAENLDRVLEMGLITFANQVEDYSIFNADYVALSTYNQANGAYRVTTAGISAKNMGDTFWLALYAKLDDGSYVYTDLKSFSPSMYAYALLKQGDLKTQQLMVAMLNYGAAAQVYFKHNTDNLVNKDVTAEQQALISGYSSDMVMTADKVSAEKQGAFVSNNGFTDLSVTVSFKGTFVINYYGKPVTENAGTVTLYYWDDATYQANEVLTAENATGSVEMTLNNNGIYVGKLSGFAARNLNKPVYVAMVCSDGTTIQSSGVLPYSVGEYCRYYAGTQNDFAPMAEATAVYGFYAKQYFG